MTRLCRIAGLFLLITAIFVIAQGVQPDLTNNVSSGDDQDPASSMATGTGDTVSNLQVVQITNHTGGKLFPLICSHPRISGNWITWEARENERDGGGLYLYDIANGTEKRILDCSRFVTKPVVSGNWIGWVENQIDSSGDDYPYICAYDIQNDTIIQVTTGYPAMPLQKSESRALVMHEMSTLDISGDRIAWHDRRDGNMDIYYKDLLLSGEEEEQLTRTLADETCPSISGDLVVWAEQYYMEGFNIILHNLTSGDQKRITDLPAMRRDQMISGNHVIWSQFRDTDYDICCYNVSSGNTTWITDEPVNQLWPRISGNIIVWSDDRGWRGHDIYAYDLSTQTEIQITDDSVDHIWADVDGNTIVWTDDRTGNYEVYMCMLENASEVEPQVYTVQLNSIPAGADAYVNDVLWGRTPSTLSFDQIGMYHIKLLKKGFRPYIAALDVSASMTYVVNLEREVSGKPAGLDDLRISITVDSVPRGANVSIDGADRGTTLTTVVNLPASRYPIEITLEGYRPNSTIIQPSGLDNVLNVTLIPETNDTNLGGSLLLEKDI